MKPTTIARFAHLDWFEVTTYEKRDFLAKAAWKRFAKTGRPTLFAPDYACVEAAPGPDGPLWTLVGRTRASRQDRPLATARGLADGSFIFVRMLNGRVRVDAAIGGGGHGKLAGQCRFVLYAGEVVFAAGRLVSWTNQSGTYRCHESAAATNVDVFPIARFASCTPPGTSAGPAPIPLADKREALAYLGVDEPPALSA